MENRCGDYQWVKGTVVKISEGDRFQILADPYGKRVIIEQHIDGKFQKLIYDSNLLDYRKLNPREKLGWSREELENDRFLIRDRDHTPVLIEEHVFNGDRPIECRYYSPHLIFLGHQKIFYQEFGDPFDGVTLFDTLNKVVLTKKYALLPDGTFGELLFET